MSPEPVLLEASRGPLVESRHRGTLVLLDAGGSVQVALGDVDGVVFPRSSLKPLQATAMVAAGWAGTSASVALAAASHDGEEMHLLGVRETLRGAGLTPDALGCPADVPMGRAAMLAWVGAGHGPERVCHNCSGKHAGMVATCAAAGWPVDSYRELAHPLQQAIVARIGDVCGTPVVASSVDGCGAPAHALPLIALARGFARIATAPAGTAEGRVAAAMRAYPELVGGTGRAVTELMAGVPGLVAKDGAEGVWGAALPDGRAFAVKVADGASRALPPLLAAALRVWGFDGPAVRRWSAVPVLGGGEPVGTLTWSPDLRAALELDHV
jgi:L-asparaginase II